MIVYTVHLQVLDARRRGALIRYLKTRHIPDLLAQPGFQSAELRAVEGSADLVCEYRVRSLKDLKHYFKSAAPALRADVASRFGPEVLQLSRETSRTLAATFPAPR